MTSDTLLIVLGAVIFLATLAKVMAKKSKAKKSVEKVKAMTGWYIGPITPNGENHSEGMPERPTLQGNGWIFAFPSKGGVDAVINASPEPLVGAKGVTLPYTVTGGGFTEADTGEPGRVGFCLQRKGDDWKTKPQHRLYGKHRPLLVAGNGMLTIPFVAGQMHDLNGKDVSRAVIDDVLANLDNYQVVFGGRSASHGVYALEPSTFALIGLTIDR